MLYRMHSSQDGRQCVPNMRIRLQANAMETFFQQKSRTDSPFYDDQSGNVPNRTLPCQAPNLHVGQSVRNQEIASSIAVVILIENSHSGKNIVTLKPWKLFLIFEWVDDAENPSIVLTYDDDLLSSQPQRLCSPLLGISLSSLINE